MQFNIELKTYDEFKKFWETIAEREGYYFIDLLYEFGLEHLAHEKELDFEDEDGNDNIGIWNDTIDDIYLNHYYFSMEDSWDRAGDVKVRMFVPMVNPITVHSLLTELPDLEARRIPLAKKYTLAMEAQRLLWKDETNQTLAKKCADVAPTDSEMKEMKEIEDKLYCTYGIGIGMHND
jgi:hypothetical protein